MTLCRTKVFVVLLGQCFAIPQQKPHAQLTILLVCVIMKTMIWRIRANGGFTAATAVGG